MPVPSGPKQADAAIRNQAEAWFARMRAPNAASFARDFEQWRSSDPRCAVEFARLEEKVDFTKLLRLTATGRGRDLRRARGFGGGAIPAPYQMAAAVIVLLCVIGAASLLHGSSTGGASVAATRIGQIRPQQLADGSVVTLDTDSKIAFSFSERVRSVRLLQGRARFNVAHDNRRPFIVAAAGRTVTATGTIFDVALYDTKIRVSLLRGAVEVARGWTPPGKRGAVARLRPGEVMQATVGQPEQEITSAARGEDQWVGGMLSFDAMPMSDLLAQTNRYSSAKIRLASPGLAKLRVTGAFRPVPLDHLAATLSTAFSLRLETRPDGDIVLHQR